MPKISVIVPVYRVEKYIHRCVDSILAQTCRDFELILVDDGSPDQCGRICEEYAAMDSRIHVIHRENGGLSAARNSGIEWALANSDSEYLTFIDSDDWVHPRFLEDMYFGVVSSGVKVCVAKHRYMLEYNSENVQYVDYPELEVMSAEDLLVNYEWYFNYACIKLYHKECFCSVRYPVGRVFEDTFTTYKILFSCGEIALVNRELYFYYKNMEGITRSPWNPKELVIFEGMRQQMDFYRANGFDRAYDKEHRLYLNHHAYQITRIRENRADLEQNKPYIRQLRRDMLAIIRESGGKYNRKNMPQCYAAAYPRLTEARRLAGAALRTMKDGGLSKLLDKAKEVMKR